MYTISKIKETKVYNTLVQPASVYVPYYWKVAVIAIISALIFRFSLCFNDSDLFFIIATGRYIINNGIPHENPFITTPEQAIVIQNWLYCVIIAFVYDKFHILGLWAMQTISIFGMLTVMLDFTGFKKSKNKLMHIILSVAAMFIFGYINLRPEMLTFILIMLEINGLEKYIATGKIRYLLLLPLVMLLEINCHASYWIMHIVIIIPYIMPSFKFMRATDTHIKGKKAIILGLFSVLSVILLFINPYGTDNISYVFDAVSSDIINKLNISEMQPITFKNYEAYIFMITTIAFAILWKDGKLMSTEIYMYLGLSFLFCTAVKWIAFYAIAFLFFSRVICRETEDNNKYYIHNLEGCIAGKIAAITLAIILAIGISIYTCTKGETAYTIRQIQRGDEYINITGFIGISDIADYLDENDPNASIYATYQNANYFEYRGYKVFYDARPEIYSEKVTGSNTITEQIITINDSKDYNEWTSAVDNLNVNYIVVQPSQRLLYFYLVSNSDKYKQVEKNDNFILYKKLI